jgi:hypothetical protein
MHVPMGGKNEKSTIVFEHHVYTRIHVVAFGVPDNVKHNDNNQHRFDNDDIHFRTNTTAPISFSISLNSTTKTIDQGGSFILVVTLDGISSFDSIGWAADGDLLQISPNGLNAVISAGAATGEDTITVTVSKGGVDQSASCVVTVNPIVLDLTVESEQIELSQGESLTLSLVIEPIRSATSITWSDSNGLLTIVEDGLSAQISAGAATGTTTIVITASIYDQTFTKEIQVTINGISPFVSLASSAIDVNVGQTVEIDLDYLAAYLQGVTWNVEFSADGLSTAEITAEDKLSISGLLEGQVTLTVTMTTNGIEYQDTLAIYVRPLGFVSVSTNVYDPYDLQLNFTESTLFSSIEASIWQEYDILLGATNNTGQGEVRGQFVFAMTHLFAKDGDKDVIQVMGNGMSAIAVKIPDSIDDLAAIEFSMKMADLEETLDKSWRLEFFIATVIDGKPVLYAKKLDTNSAIALGSLTIEPADLLRDGYQTYRFFVNSIPQNAGNYIVISFGNTTSFNGTEESRTYIESFSFIDKELTAIELTTVPTKSTYVVNQTFDPAGLVISALYSAGNSIPVAYEDLTIDYDFSTTGTKTVTISYGAFHVDIEVTVIERAISTLVVSTMPGKIVYTAGDVFDPAGMVVTANYNDGTSEVVTTYTYDMLPLAAGVQAVVLAFDSLTVNVPVTVNALALTGIAVTVEPTKTAFVVGQSANYQGIVVTASFSDASTEVLLFSALTFAGFDSSSVAADQVITVSYGGQTTTFTIDIIAKALVSIQVQRYPKITYLLNEEANWSSMLVRGVNNDGTTEDISLQNLLISGFDSTTLGKITVVVSYQTFSVSFFVTITEDTGYTQLNTSDVDFDTTNLVANTTMYTSFFSGENPASIADFDVLLGRVLNDAERNLQYSAAIYMMGEGGEKSSLCRPTACRLLRFGFPTG